MKKDERLVKEVIKKYGDVIDLKKTPFVLIEIFRNFGKLFQEIPDGGLPCGGVPPPPPPPGPDDRVGIDNSAILKEILKLSRDMKTLRSEVKAVRDKLNVK